MNFISKFSETIQNQFNTYVDYVYEVNQKFNLTGFKTKKQIYEHLVLDVVDCLLNLNIDFNFLKVLDVGSGSGSPGIIISILYPNANLFMIDSNYKKCQFIESLIKKLNLKKAFIICNRIENLESKFIDFFDLGISRAVNSINVMNELIVKWIKIHGFIVHLKSKNYEAELKLAENKIKDLGIVLKRHFSFTNREMIFNNFIYEKVIKTSEIFPRNWKLIKKENL